MRASSFQTVYCVLFNCNIVLLFFLVSIVICVNLYLFCGNNKFTVEKSIEIVYVHDKMDLFVKIVTFSGLFGHLTLVNSVVLPPPLSSSSSTNGSKATYYTGLLSDVLHTNRENDLAITPLCNQELSAIQNGLNRRDIWAIKCK